MLKIKQSAIRKGIINFLNNQQNTIDCLPGYEDRVRHSKILWQNKKKSNARKSVFKSIEKELQNIAVGRDSYCNYCEANIGSNIEHIYPRGLYPCKTFDWENFLWACNQCNGRHKVAQFQIFESPQSSQIINLIKDYSFTPPLNDDAVFINPRADNPMDYLRLNLDTAVFEIISEDVHSRQFKRSDYTLKVLKLNLRTGLLNDRIKAIGKYKSLFNRFLNAKKSISLTELNTCIADVDFKIGNHSFDEEKNRLCLFLKDEILSKNHQTVWKEMQKQYFGNSILKDMFSQYPQALNW
jgi:uncharacterized protein (TIGR02646 family)